MIEIQNRVISILSDRVGVVDLASKVDLEKDLGLDSLDIMEFVMALEDEFELAIGDDLIAGMTTVEKVVKTIDSLTKVK